MNQPNKAYSWINNSICLSVCFQWALQLCSVAHSDGHAEHWAFDLCVIPIAQKARRLVDWIRSYSVISLKEPEYWFLPSLVVKSTFAWCNRCHRNHIGQVNCLDNLRKLRGQYWNAFPWLLLASLRYILFIKCSILALQFHMRLIALDQRPIGFISTRERERKTERFQWVRTSDYMATHNRIQCSGCKFECTL